MTTEPKSKLTAARRLHLETQQAELQRKYENLSKRTAAVDADLSVEMDGERKLGLQNRREQLLTEREEVVKTLDDYDQQLAGAPAPSPEADALAGITIGSIQATNVALRDQYIDMRSTTPELTPSSKSSHSPPFTIQPDTGRGANALLPNLAERVLRVQLSYQLVVQRRCSLLGVKLEPPVTGIWLAADGQELRLEGNLLPQAASGQLPESVALSPGAYRISQVVVWQYAAGVDPATIEQLTLQIEYAEAGQVGGRQVCFPLNFSEAGLEIVATTVGQTDDASRTFGLVGSPPPSAAPIEISQRYALLIGLRDYRDPNYRSLPHTVYDVIKLDEVLTGAGYTVICLHPDQKEERLQPDIDNILGHLKNLTASTGPGDLLLIYFGGHGDVDSDGTAYLVPERTYHSALAERAIKLDDFKNMISSSDAQVKIVLLDACHSGVGRGSQGMDPAFERSLKLEAEGTAILAACRKGEVAYEHNAEKHGAFTYFLLRGLRGEAAPEQQYLTFDDLKAYVTVRVKQWAISQSLKQFPNAETHIVGDPALVEFSPPNQS